MRGLLFKLFVGRYCSDGGFAHMRGGNFIWMWRRPGVDGAIWINIIILASAFCKSLDFRYVAWAKQRQVAWGLCSVFCDTKAMVLQMVAFCRHGGLVLAGCDVYTNCCASCCCVLLLA